MKQTYVGLRHVADALKTIYTVQCTQKQHPKPTEGIGVTVT